MSNSSTSPALIALPRPTPSAPRVSAVLTQMKRLCIVAAAAVVCASSPAAAQRMDTLRLSLPDAVGIALRNSDEIRLSQSLIDVADAQVGVARATGLPQLRVNSTYSHVWENARANAVGQIFNQPNTYVPHAQRLQAVEPRVPARERVARRLGGRAADDVRARV